MGMFDSLADLQKEIARVTDGVAKIQSNAQSIRGGVVKAIDSLEDTVTNLPTEKEIKRKLKQKTTTTTSGTIKKNKPGKKSKPAKG